MELCFTNTYFLFQSKYFKQLEGAAMESPIIPIVANLFMESLESKATQHRSQPPVCGEGM